MIDRTRVGSSFERGAHEYDCHTPVQQRVVQHLCDSLELMPEHEPASILDIGCGTGMLLEQLAERYPLARLAGIDLAEAMLHQAARRRHSARFELIRGDAEQLPFSKGQFDLVVSTSTFQWLDQLTLAFSEAHRVLAEGGYFCFSLFGAGTLRELQESWREALVRTGRQPSGNHDGTHRFHTPEMVRDALIKQGFGEVELRVRREVVRYPDLPRLLQAIKRIGAGTARPPAGGGLGWRRVLHEMAAVYSERFGSQAGVPASYEVIYAAGKRSSQADISEAMILRAKG